MGQFFITNGTNKRTVAPALGFALQVSNSCHLSIRVIRDLKAQYVNYLVKTQNNEVVRCFRIGLAAGSAH
jgi:hypothetical protein